MRNLLLISGVLVGLGTAAGGVWALQRDTAPRYLGSTNFDRVAAVATPGDMTGISLASQQQAMLDCANVLANVRAASSTHAMTEQESTLTARCLEIADYTTSVSPANSHAWYIGAAASALLEDWAGMNRRYVQSVRTGRSEQWIANLRVALSETHRSRLDEASLKASDQDLALLAGSVSGVALIAYRYVNEADFRERITAIVETLPVEDQQKFLTRVRQLAQARS